MRSGRTIILIAATTVLIGLVSVPKLLIRSQPPFGNSFPPRTKGISLDLAKLSADEKVLIAVSREQIGVSRPSRWEYAVEGPAPLRFSALNLPAYPESDEPAFTSGSLTSEDVDGLSAYLRFLRRDFGGGGHFPTKVNVTYYQGETQIGEEAFTYPTSLLESLHWENDQIKSSYEGALGNVSREAFLQIIPPWLIEERLAIGGSAARP